MNTFKKVLGYTTIIIILLVANTHNSQAGEQKKPFNAFIMSFIIPGLGQYYAESPGWCKLFISTELAIWSGYYYNTLMMEARSQDCFSQAALHAGVNPSGFGASYLNALGTFNSSYEYNLLQFQSVSNPRLYTGKQSWSWDNETERQRYQNLMKNKLDYKNNMKLCISGIILNHFLAGLNASKLAKEKNIVLSTLRINVINNGLIAVYTRSF